MSDPWLTVIGLGEDGLPGLSDASRAALAGAEVIFGGPRHLALAGAGARGREWPVPFDVAPVLACRGQAVVVLASGDPFWFGAGAVLAAAIPPGEMRVLPGVSSFALACARLGWRIEETRVHGLHAAPFARLRHDLSPGARLVVSLRDGAAVGELAAWLAAQGFGDSPLWAMEALGGPRERIRTFRADNPPMNCSAPVLMAVQVQGTAGLPRTPGLPDDAFAHDGQITKAPVRALTMAALAPRSGERLWDLGAGSGSVSVEWCRASGGWSEAVEARADRAANIAANAAAFGLDHRITLHQGKSMDLLATLPRPDAVFVGGGFDAELFGALRQHAPGTRLVVNAVALETQALLTRLAAQGGELMKIDLAHAAPLGGLTAWAPARTLLQWSATL